MTGTTYVKTEITLCSMKPSDFTKMQLLCFSSNLRERTSLRLSQRKFTTRKELRFPAVGERISFELEIKKATVELNIYSKYLVEI